MVLIRNLSKKAMRPRVDTNLYRACERRLRASDSRSLACYLSSTSFLFQRGLHQCYFREHNRQATCSHLFPIPVIH